LQKTFWNKGKTRKTGCRLDQGNAARPTCFTLATRFFCFAMKTLLRLRDIYPQFLWITLWIAARKEHNFFLQHDACFVLLNVSSALSSSADTD
jgi:hypothetical protein